MHKFLTIKSFQIHRSLTKLLTNSLRKGQNRCTEMHPNSIKSCPFELIAGVHTYLFDSHIDLIFYPQAKSIKKYQIASDLIQKVCAALCR